MISLAIAVSIFLLNLFIKIVSRMISASECHHFYTSENLFISWKLIIFLSLNQILFPFIVNLFLYTANGLAADIFWAAIIQGLVIPFTDFIPPAIFALKRMYFRRRFRSHSFFISQESLNKHFENPEVDISMWYVALICKLLLNLAYAPFLPLIVPVMGLGTVVEYWVKKYTLLRLSRRPKPINHRFTKIMMQFVKPAILLYGISIAVFDIGTGINNATIFICLIFWCVPVSIFKRLFRKLLPASRIKEEIRYEEAVKYFFTVSYSQRYELSNPVTRILEIAEKGKDSSALKQFVFEEEAKPSIPIASVCFPRSRLQSQVTDSVSGRSVTADYVRISDTQINSS